MRKMNQFVLLLLAILSVVTVVGCGGGGSSQSQNEIKGGIDQSNLPPIPDPEKMMTGQRSLIRKRSPSTAKTTKTSLALMGLSTTTATSKIGSASVVAVGWIQLSQVDLAAEPISEHFRGYQPLRCFLIINQGSSKDILSRNWAPKTRIPGFSSVITENVVLTTA